MDKTLYISSHTRGEDKFVTVTHTEDMDMRKTTFYASESDKKRFKNEVKNIHDKVKSASTYVGTSLDFIEIDWYSSETDMYEVPYYGIKKGNRTVSEGSNMEGSIPKDWEKELKVTFKNPKQFGAVLKAVEALGYTLTSDEVKEVKKAIKNGNSFNKEVEAPRRRMYW